MGVLPTWPERQKPTQGVLQRENDGCQRPRGEPSTEEMSGAGAGEARVDGEAAGGT